MWFQAQIRTPEYQTAGMTLAGTPGVVLGRGPHLAWAFTNNMLDDHDLFFERLDERGERYLRAGEWRPVESEEVTIAIRGGGEHTVTLRATDLGPLLDVDPEAGMPGAQPDLDRLPPRRPAGGAARPLPGGDAGGGPGGDRRLRLPGPEPGGGLRRRRSALHRHRPGSQRRMEGIEATAPAFGVGRLPAPGWQGRLRLGTACARAPATTVARPAADRLVTANHDIRPAGYSLSLVAEFFPSHRADRITELLDRRRDWDAEGFGALQGDVVSLYARDLVAALGDEDWRGDAERAYRALRGWDFAMELHGPAALYAFLERRLLEDVFGDEVAAHGFEPFADARCCCGRCAAR